MRYIKKRIKFSDKDVSVDIGGTQPGDMVVDGGVFYKTAFNGTSPVINVGFASNNQGGAADPDALATNLAANAVGQVKFDELAATTNKHCTVADRITAILTTSGGTTDAGEAIVWAAILNTHPNNPIQ